jgi:hypothetical protein
MSEAGIPSEKLREGVNAHAPSILLEKADFLLHLGVPRAALVLYDWACDCAPADPDALQGQARARQIAADTLNLQAYTFTRYSYNEALY